MTLDRAIEVIARTVLAEAYDYVDWEDHPDIGQYDWEAVAAKVTELAPSPSNEEYQDAYALLAARAGEIGDTH